MPVCRAIILFWSGLSTCTMHFQLCMQFCCCFPSIWWIIAVCKGIFTLQYSYRFKEYFCLWLVHDDDDDFFFGFFFHNYDDDDDDDVLGNDTSLCYLMYDVQCKHQKFIAFVIDTSLFSCVVSGTFSECFINMHASVLHMCDYDYLYDRRNGCECLKKQKNKITWSIS